MKKIISTFLIFSLFACNDQSSDSKEKQSTASSTSADVSSTAGCGTLILFHKGVEIGGTNYDANGKETSTQTTIVTDVTEEGGMLVANSSSVMNGKNSGKEIKLTYKCDGTNLYLDMTSMLQNFEGMTGTNSDAKPVQFPINVSVGEILPDASYTVSVNRGATKMDITSSFKNRKVSAKENITTAAGSWDCYKISSDIESDVQGLDEKMKKIMEAVKEKMKMSITMWYSPKLGIVRTEMYQNGKLNSRSDITSIKE